MKKWIIIVLVLVALVAVPLVILAKQYYDARYVLDDLYYSVVPLDYDITPYIETGGRVTDYSLKCFNADGEARDLTFTVLIDAHSSDLYPPGTYIKVSVSKHLVIGRRAVDRASVPERALERIEAGFAPSAARSPAEYADERTRHLEKKNTASLAVSCTLDGTALRYIYVYGAGEKAAAEAAAQLLDPVYYVQYRTDREAFPELTAIFLEIRLDGGVEVFSKKYDSRVAFDYESEG